MNKCNGHDEVDLEQHLEVRLIEKHGWPSFLAKAAVDPFDYAAYVKDLGIVRFTDAAPAGHGWVRLILDNHDTAHNHHLPCPFERGVEVRLSDICWVADAPHGS